MTRKSDINIGICTATATHSKDETRHKVRVHGQQNRVDDGRREMHFDGRAMEVRYECHTDVEEWS
jgi:hypothetical protein